MEGNLYIMIGLPGCGKSTYINNIIKQNNYQDINIKLSSDDIRIELYGELDQNHNGEVFDEMRRRCKEFLKQGKNVYYDATNISRKKRIALINEMNKYYNTVNAVCLICHIDTILERNRHRGIYNVPDSVIFRMLKNFQAPIKQEGYNFIDYINTDNSPNYSVWDEIWNQNKKVNINISAFELYSILRESIPQWMLEYNQNNKHHTETLGNHAISVMWHCFNFANTNLPEDINTLLIAAYYHDFGKPTTREDKEDNSIYYKHNNVSVYLMLVDIISNIDNDDHHIAILIELMNNLIILVENHDYIFSYKTNEEAYKSMSNKYGERMANLLMMLNEADRYRPGDNLEGKIICRKED